MSAEHERRKADLKARAVKDGYPGHVGYGEMLMMLDETATADRARLEAILEHAAYWYAASALWAKLPAGMPGDRGPRAVTIRRTRAEISEKLWLAAQVAISERIFGPS